MGLNKAIESIQKTQRDVKLVENIKQNPYEVDFEKNYLEKDINDLLCSKSILCSSENNDLKGNVDSTS